MSYEAGASGIGAAVEVERKARRAVPTGLGFVIPIAVFAYLVAIRTRGISETFWLLGDQILYWRIALRPLRDLPISGGPSSVGGTTLGPAFLWTMWGIRHVIGPFTDNLPHAGGIGLSIIQSLADAALLAGIWKRFRSLPLALGVTLVVASAPYDMALTATIWNPPLAVAFVKLTIALILLAPADPSAWWAAAVSATAMLAVQAHSSAIFFAAPVIASLTCRALLERRWRGAARIAVVSAAAILVVELPYLLNAALHSGERTSPAVVVDSVAFTFSHPEALRPLASLDALANGCRFILVFESSGRWFALLLLASAAATAWRLRRDIVLVSATVLPLVCAAAGFSFWRWPYDFYWYLTVAPCAALTIALALTAWPRAARPIAIAIAVIAIVAQPMRQAQAMTLHRLPQYAPLVRGVRTIRRYAPEVRRIDTDLHLPPTTDPVFLYTILGGRVTDDGRLIAAIDASGRVTFRDAPPDRANDAAR